MVSNIIICDTVLAEVRKNSLSAFNRLCGLLRKDSNVMITFTNTNHADCYLEREKGESPNDYNDRSEYSPYCLHP